MLMKLFKWSGAIIVALIVLGVMIDSERGKSNASKPTEVVVREEASPPVSVTADALLAAYKENEIAANQKYKDKRLLLSARIASIEADIGDDPYLVLSAGSEFEFNRPHARMARSEAASAAALKKGQKITLLCIGASEIAGTPMLDDCSIQ